ncbi:MAG: hypothetical protein DME57_05340 [Verrucomicrobia bacterium]|nr:MAG: hypothetical protein DME57_05340 [Verrucomicrobiota bacterium]
MVHNAGADEPPPRPPTVPASAFWLGGRELTGVWIDIRNVESRAFTANVYFATGQIWMSDRFVAPSNRLTEPITADWLRRHIIAPNGYDIIVFADGKELAFRGDAHSSPEPTKPRH